MIMVVDVDRVVLLDRDAHIIQPPHEVVRNKSRVVHCHRKFGVQYHLAESVIREI